ncbi:MAG TPA: hypothetical protein VKB81_18100 [Nitrospira sp.]|nr:hypothetical protein [Nitrospira sp.]
MATEPLTNPSVVWVRVSGVKEPGTQWTYLLSQDDPNSPGYGMIRDRGISSDKLCYSYTALSAWLLIYGFTPPPQDYFAPSRQELDAGAGSILRRVTRPR